MSNKENSQGYMDIGESSDEEEGRIARGRAEERRVGRELM